MSSKTAVIIQGHPELIENNPRAEDFYANLKSLLEQQGFLVTLDPGAPYTTPIDADVWIGHSRGADRLRFAPEGTMTIGIGVPMSGENNFPIVNNPEDEMVKRTFEEGKIIDGKENVALDDTAHYVLTDKMKGEILRILQNLSKEGK